MGGLVVVDYGMGNVFSVCHALRHAGGEPSLSPNPRDITGADQIVLPGVGALGRAMAELRDRHLVDPLLSFIDTGRPFLGLCVGMQMLMSRSEELGEHEGLGSSAGGCRRCASLRQTVGGGPLRVPHIGWTAAASRQRTLTPRAGTRSLLRDVNPGLSAFYFVHSYSVHPADPGRCSGRSRLRRLADRRGPRAPEHLWTAVPPREERAGRTEGASSISWPASTLSDGPSVRTEAGATRTVLLFSTQVDVQAARADVVGGAIRPNLRRQVPSRQGLGAHRHHAGGDPRARSSRMGRSSGPCPPRR